MLKGAAVALLRLLVNGAQVQRTPELTVVPGSPASVAWVNPTLLTAGISVSAGEEGFCGADVPGCVRQPHHQRRRRRHR